MEIQINNKEKDILLHSIEYFSTFILEILNKQKQDGDDLKDVMEVMNNILNIKGKIIMGEKEDKEREKEEQECIEDFYKTF